MSNPVSFKVGNAAYAGHTRRATTSNWDGVRFRVRSGPKPRRRRRSRARPWTRTHDRTPPQPLLPPPGPYPGGAATVSTLTPRAEQAAGPSEPATGLHGQIIDKKTPLARIGQRQSPNPVLQLGTAEQTLTIILNPCLLNRPDWLEPAVGMIEFAGRIMGPFLKRSLQRFRSLDLPQRPYSSSAHHATFTTRYTGDDSMLESG